MICVEFVQGRRAIIIVIQVGSFDEGIRLGFMLVILYYTTKNIFQMISFLI